jgi:hypothetical protein
MTNHFRIVKNMTEPVIIRGFRVPSGGGFFVTGYLNVPDSETHGLVRFLVDSGADTTVLSYADARALNLDYGRLAETRQEILTIGGPLTMHVARNVALYLPTEDGSLHRILLRQIYVLPPRRWYGHDITTSILGMDALRNFAIDFVPSHARLYLSVKRHKRRARPVVRARRIRCFLSHNSRDKRFVRRLAADLNRNSVDVWFDEWEIRPGDSITNSIEDGLRRYNNFVLIMTPSAMQSRWVARELSTTLYRYNSSRKQGQRKVRIIPALRKQCTIPLWLRDIKYVDFRSKYRIALKELVDALRAS